MTRLLYAFCCDRSGATAVEYGVIASLVAVVIITVLGATGCQLNRKFSAISSALN